MRITFQREGALPGGEGTTMERITSRTNPLLTHIRKLGADRGYRGKQGEFLCDGGKLMEEAMKWKAEITAVVTSEPESLPEISGSARVISVPGELLRSVSPLQNPQSVLFACRIPEWPMKDGEGRDRLIVLEGIQDPGNLGTVLRTADAFGMDRVILLPGCADPYNPKTVRATMGAVFRMPLSEMGYPELKQFSLENGISLYAAALDADAEDVRAVKLQRAAAVVGSEGSGISREARALCQGCVKIPMAGRCESLNAAVAAAILMWEMNKDIL